MTRAMHVTCTYDGLRHALASVSRIVSSRNVLPSMGHVLLETEGKRLRLTTTNFGFGVTRWIDADIHEEGAVSVPAKLLNDVVSSLPHAPISMTLDARTCIVHLTCGTFAISINGADAAIFPHGPTIDADSLVVTLPAALLRQSIMKVSYAASSDEVRPILQGIHIHLSDSAVVLSASDGFRLARQTIPLPEPIDRSQDVIVPARSLEDLARLVEDGAVALMMAPNGAHGIRFDAGDVRLVSRIIQGTFPDVGKVIPSQHRTRAIVERDALTRAVTLASFFAAASSHVVMIHAYPGDAEQSGRVSLSANAAEVGDNIGWIDAEIQGGEERIALNARFLAEALAAITSKRVMLDILSPKHPAVLRPDDNAYEMHLIMPMMIHP